MLKIKLFILCTLCVCSISTAQTANEILGTSVTETEGIFTTGSSITTGDYNVLIGDGVGSSLTSGSNNTMLGTAAGANQTSASYNVFIGRQAGFNNILGTDLTFIGYRAGYFTGFNTVLTSDLTFIGAGAGFNLTDGNDSVFIGDRAGLNVTTGDDNTYVGTAAGGGGGSSVSSSTQATTNPATGSDNTAVGSSAGNLLTTGYRNAFFGNDAGYDNTEGYKNTFVGDSTGIDVGTGRLNTFVGQAAGNATEHADYNTFIGSNAGGDNNRTNNTDDANRNTYVGVFTGFSNREGEDNVGMGAFANYVDPNTIDILNITGRYGASMTSVTRDRTTFIGAQAFPNNNDVIVIGYKARADGAFGIAIGSNSRARSTNSMAIGNAVDVTNANTMALGGNLTTNRVSVGIGTLAANQNASLELADVDKGFLVNRLTTIERIALETAAANGNPIDVTQKGLMVYDTDLNVLFTWDGTLWNAAEANTDLQDLDLDAVTHVLSITNDASTVDLTAYLDNTDAQELSLSGTTLAITGNPTTVDLSTLQDGTGTDDQNLTSATLSGNNLTIAIEGGTSVNVDLSPILSALEAKNTDQQAQIDDLISRMETLEACACSVLAVADAGDAASKSTGPILYQNIPNPFNNTTSIKYYVPLNYKNAAIIFSNTSGQVIDNVTLNILGDQELFFNSTSLASGVYYYTLFVDGRQIDTKKMIIK